MAFDVAASLEVPIGAIVAAAHDLARAGRWKQAANLLDVSTAKDVKTRALLALAAAEVALESDWFGGTMTAGARLERADEICAIPDLDQGSRWDLKFLHLRHDYLIAILVDGAFQAGPQGKSPDVSPTSDGEAAICAPRLRTIGAKAGRRCTSA